MTATTNQAYIEKAIQGALDDFDQAAGPSNINDPLFVLCCRLLELSHAAPDMLSEVDAETLASDRAARLGHDAASIRDTWKSAQRHVGSTAAVIPQPTYQNGNGQHSAGYADLAAYAQSRGAPVEVFTDAGWSDSELFEYEYPDPKTGKPEKALTDQQRLVYLRRRRALRFETDAGPRWRLIDEDKPRPKYWHHFGAHQGAARRWYRLAEAVGLAYIASAPLVLCNGEASTVVAQHWGVPATAEAGGGEKEIPAHLLTELVTLWPVDRPVVVALDCDGKGHKAALQKAEQLRAAGYTDVRAVDLSLGQGEDLADACRLHQAGALAYVLACPDLVPPPTPGQQPAPTPQPGPVTQSQAIINQLARLGYTFKLNLCTDTIECNGEPLTDLKTQEIRTALRNEGRKQFGAVDDAIGDHAARHSYHPIRDYLRSLTWDGMGWIAHLAAHLDSSDPPIVYDNGVTRPATEVYLERFLIGAVAKALDGAQNVMLVLSGPQNIGKSGLASWLCPPVLHAAHYAEGPIRPDDKDHRIRLMNVWLWEVSELDATTRKADISALKEFITREQVKERKSYGRHDTIKPALTSFIGTVNNDSGFLVDPTGNRRFMVLGLTGINWAYRQIPVDQLWAEVVARYRRGEAWRLSREELAYQTERNREYQADSVLVDYLRKHFFRTGDPSDVLTAADVVDHLRGKDIKLSGSDRSQAMEISAAMALLGIPKERRNNVRYYIGIMTK